MIANCIKICTFILVMNCLNHVYCHDGSLDNKSHEKNTSAENSSEKTVDFTKINLTEIAASCNESFRVQMDYLKELNETGSFPDETNKTPMCYLKCYLEKIGILNDDEINMERAVDLTWVSSDDTIIDCQKEMIGNSCEKVYYLARCVMTRALVDGKDQEAKKR